METNHQQPTVNLSNPLCTALFAVIVLVLLASGLALADNIYVANSYNNAIEKFDSSGTDLGVFANSGYSGPSGLAFDSSGYLYVSNFGNNTIEKFDSSGNGTLFANSGLNGPTCIAVLTPEPATLFLLTLGGLILRRRK